MREGSVHRVGDSHDLGQREEELLRGVPYYPPSMISSAAQPPTDAGKDL